MDASKSSKAYQLDGIRASTAAVPWPAHGNDRIELQTVTSHLRIALALALALLFALPVIGQRKKKKGSEEEPTQQLEVLPDPPPFVTAETARLGFLVSPMSAKGLLSQQTRDAIRALMRNSHGAQVIKLRAFVAGTGDVRRIQTIVSEEFSEKKQIIPAVSVVQAGALPMEGAQVILEAVTVERKPVNPDGVAFFSGQQVAAEGRVENPLQPVMPLVEKSLANLTRVAEAAKVQPASMMKVTCLVSSLADFNAVNQKVTAAFPQAAVSIVQLQRGPLRSIVECEGVGRLASPPSAPIVMLNPPGVEPSPNYSQAALVSAPRLLLTGEQLAFGQQEADVKLAFERLGRLLTSGKSLWPSVIWTSYYPLTNPIVEKIRAVRFNYLDKGRPPASTLILFEGLPSLDASFGMEVVAVAN